VRGLCATRAAPRINFGCGTIAAIGLAAALSIAAPAAAQDAPLIGAAAKEAPGATALDELRQDIARFETHAAEWRAKAAEYERAQRDAPGELAQLDAEIAREEALLREYRIQADGGPS